MKKRPKKSAKQSSKRPKKQSSKKSPPVKIVKRDQRYERFCQEYVVDLNGTRAAIAAGYAKSHAHVQASQLLKKTKVKERITDLQNVTADKLEITAEWVLGELKRLACKAELDRDRIRALDLLGKHLKLFTDRVQLEGLEGLAEQIAEARKRANGRK